MPRFYEGCAYVLLTPILIEYHTLLYAFYALLFGTLLLGIYAGSNIKTLSDYVLADKKYETTLLLFTFLATHIGGANVLEVPAIVFTEGIIITVAFWGLVIAFLIRALLIAPRMGQFADCLTMGDVMKKCYGSQAQVITGILGLAYSICITAVQLRALGLICQAFIGVQPAWSMALGGIVLAIYAAVGGIKAVTITDAFHFVLLIAVIVLLASMALYQVGGIQQLFAQVPADKLLLFDHPKFSYYFTCFLLWSIFSVGITSPPTFQRLLMAKESKYLQKQYLITSAFDPIFQGLIMVLGLAGLVLYPHIAAKQVVPHLAQTLLPTSLQWLVLLGLAVVLSTADSYLHAAGVTLAHDIIKPLASKRINLTELRWAQYSTLGIGVISIIIALSFEHMLRLVWSAMQCTGPVLLLPLMAGILGLSTDKRTFMVAFGATVGVFALARWYLPAECKHLAVLVSIVGNGLSFWGAHSIYQYLKTR